MKMIGQDRDGIHLEGTLFPDHLENLSQEVDVLDQKSRLPVSKGDREEVGTAWKAVTAVIDHRQILPRFPAEKPSYHDVAWMECNGIQGLLLAKIFIPDSASLHPGCACFGEERRVHYRNICSSYNLTEGFRA